MEEKACKEEIFNLLKQNKIPKAIGILDRHIQENKKLSELFASSIINFAFFHRAEKHFLLGLISWDDYNVANSKIIESAIQLAENVCSYMGIVRKRELERNALKEKRKLWLDWQKNEQIWRTRQAWLQLLDPEETQRWLKWIERKYLVRIQAMYQQKYAHIQDLNLTFDTVREKHHLAIVKIEKSLQSWGNWLDSQKETQGNSAEIQKTELLEKKAAGESRIERIKNLQNVSHEWLSSLDYNKQQTWLLMADLLDPFEWIELEEMLASLSENKQKCLLTTLDLSDPFFGRPKEVQWNSVWEEMVMDEDYDYDKEKNVLHSPGYISPIKQITDSFHQLFRQIEQFSNNP